jgi:hypothetical protein
MPGYPTQDSRKYVPRVQPAVSEVLELLHKPGMRLL